MDSLEKTNILLVDDDVILAKMLCDYLNTEGFTATHVADGETALAQALSGKYALAVVDVMMPDINGIEVLRRIRAHGTLPVIMLSARGEEVDRIIGLELGADDYVPKPCTSRELVARIRAVLRRTRTKEGDIGDNDAVVVGALTMRIGRRTVEFKNAPLDLTSTEFNILAALARNAGSTLSKQDLAKLALCGPLAPFDRRIDVHISSIRRKLGRRDDGRSWIQTIRGHGYQLSA